MLSLVTGESQCSIIMNRAGPTPQTQHTESGISPGHHVGLALDLPCYKWRYGRLSCSFQGALNETPPTLSFADVGKRFESENDLSRISPF